MYSGLVSLKHLYQCETVLCVSGVCVYLYILTAGQGVENVGIPLETVEIRGP